MRVLPAERRTTARRLGVRHRQRAMFDLGAGSLVPLGVGDDDYRAQQSIRSLANASRPEQPTLKLALSIVPTEGPA